MEGLQGNNKRTNDTPLNDLLIKRTRDDDMLSEIKAICAIVPVSEAMASDALERYIASTNRVDLAIDWCLENNILTENNNPIENNFIDVKEFQKGNMVESNGVENIKELVDCVVAIFPDVDPIYVQDQLRKINNEVNKLETLCNHLMELNGKYPLLKNGQELDELKEKDNLNVILNLDDFMKRFPKPQEIFIGDKRPLLTYNYISAAITYLLNDFNMLHANYVRKIFGQMTQNFTLTHEELTLQNQNGIAQIHRLKSKRAKKPLYIHCEFFNHELFYVQNRVKIDHYEENYKKQLMDRIEDARANNLLRTCECCYDDEVLIEEMIECTSEHLFCNLCLKRAVEVGVGEGVFKFNCFKSECKDYFSYPVIQSVVDPKLFSNLLKLSLEDDLRMADIPNLVSCPFCSFCVIMPDQNDKLFRCLNPDCMKETCRLCREPNHIPLRCNEIEKSIETKMRTFIENYMTEAMLRTCHKCNKKFYKVEGCNKMTCQCGAHMCYLCRKPVTDYSHFYNPGDNKSASPGKCILYTDIIKLHNEELAKASDEARKQFSTIYPEAATIELKYDPMDIINQKAENTCMRLYENWHYNNRHFNLNPYGGDYFYNMIDDEDDEDDADDDESYLDQLHIEDMAEGEDYDFINEQLILNSSDENNENYANKDDSSIENNENDDDIDDSSIESEISEDKDQQNFEYNFNDKNVDWDDDDYHNFDMF